MTPAELAIVALLLQQNESIHRSQTPIYHRRKEPEKFFAEAHDLVLAAEKYIEHKREECLQKSRPKP